MTGLKVRNPVRQKKGSEAYTQFIIYLLCWRHRMRSGILQLLQKPIMYSFRHF